MSGENPLTTRTELIEYLKTTSKEYTVIKFYADWCAPCKHLSPILHQMITEKYEQFKECPDKFTFIELDVDESFDLYAFLKSKKMLRGIPTVFVYKKDIYMRSDEGHMFIPQASISGTNEKEIKNILNIIS